KENKYNSNHYYRSKTPTKTRPDSKEAIDKEKEDSKKKKKKKKKENEKEKEKEKEYKQLISASASTSSPSSSLLSSSSYNASSSTSIRNHSIEATPSDLSLEENLPKHDSEMMDDHQDKNMLQSAKTTIASRDESTPRL